MLFTMPVSKTVATRQGHTIEFIAGVPTHVPKECWREVQAAGAVPEDQKAVQDKNAADTVTVDDPVERRERYFAAFEAMVDANVRGSFGASGAPHQKALQVILGFDVDAKERDELWIEFQQLKNDPDASAKAAAAAKAAEDDKLAVEAAKQVKAAMNAKAAEKAEKVATDTATKAVKKAAKKAKA